MLKIKRIYEPPLPEDGRRFLVDRLWPRGLSKGSAAVDEWRRDLAPSHELRRWYKRTPTGPMGRIFSSLPGRTGCGVHERRTCQSGSYGRKRGHYSRLRRPEPGVQPCQGSCEIHQ